MACIVINLLQADRQKVVLRDYCLAFWPLTYGVTLISMLSCMLFGIYINPLDKAVRRRGGWAVLSPIEG